LQHDFIGAPATQGNSKITAHPALGQDEQPAQGAHGLGISSALRFLTCVSAWGPDADRRRKYLI